MARLKQDIINYLLQNSTAVSGQDLADHFHVSRNAVWKTIQDLRESGYVIEADNKSGYQLASLSKNLDATQIQAQLDPFWQDLKIHVKDTVTSTNDLAKQHSIQFPHQPGLFIAQKQTAGRGRRGRSFYSALDQGLYFSLVIHPTFDNLDKITLYTVLAATTIAQVLEEIIGEKIDIKWVNDLFYRGRKISGILCEATTDLETQSISSVIIGIGLNLAGNFSTTEEATQQVAGTLFKEKLPEHFNPNLLLVEFLNQFAHYHVHFEDQAFMAGYQERLLGMGKEVYYEDNNQKHTGIIRGINPRGHLLVEDAAGDIHPLFSQEVHFSSQQFSEEY